jgi:hypothetical protein
MAGYATAGTTLAHLTNTTVSHPTGTTLSTIAIISALAPSQTSVPMDQDRGRNLQGVAVVMEILLIFMIITIIAGEILGWKNSRGAPRQAPTEVEPTLTEGVPLRDMPVSPHLGSINLG